MTVRKQPKFSVAIKSEAYQQLIKNTLGDPKIAQRFTSSIMSAVSINPQLQACDPGTILTAGLQGEALQLSPSPQMGHFYMVPFKNNKRGVSEAQFQLGYKGYIQLAIRSGQYKTINAMAVKEGEEFKFDRLTEEFEMISYIENDTERENARTVGYVGVLELNNGFKKTIYWTKEKMEEHALKYSMGYRAKKGYTFWEKNFDEMAFKTILRQLISKWGIMSIEMQSAYNADMGVIRENNEVDYVENDSNDPRINKEEAIDQTEEEVEGAPASEEVEVEL